MEGNIVDQIIDGLTSDQKRIISKASKPGSTILFNIKGMIEILHQNVPFDFIEMGYDDIEKLKRKGLIDVIRSKEESNVLQGEEYKLSPLGKEVAKKLL